MSEGLSQSDLDALLEGLSFGDSPAKLESELKMDAVLEEPHTTNGNSGESLSQDEIDKMLAEFGRG